MIGILRRYRAALVTAFLFAVLLIMMPEAAPAALGTLRRQLTTIALVLPPIFILLGLFDVWVPRETIIRHMGDESLFLGTLLAYLLGSAAAGPLYGAFPVAAVLIRKGAGFFAVMVFLGAWSTTKIPLVLFEINSLGMRFALSRLVVNVVGIAAIAWATRRLMGKAGIERLYRRIEAA